MTKYLLDTNIFIQSHRSTYPLDVIPSFWNKIKELADGGIIISIDKVKKEIFDKSSHEDELQEWCSLNLNDDFFVDSSPEINSYVEVITWAFQNPQYKQSAIDEFLETDLADPWLIAYAKANKCKIVTFELSSPDIKKRIKIPEPCKHFNVEYVTLIEMFRELKVTF